MRSVPVEEFLGGLRAIPEEDFRVGHVYEYLRRNPVDSESLRPYLFFSPNRYTRNLIYKNQLFELLAICWDVGQCSNIHNHQEQNCWMTIPLGRLRVQNYRVTELDEKSSYCRVEKTDAFDLHPQNPGEVDREEPVHQVLNLGEFNQRAVSLHIYSRPFDRCLIYSPARNEYKEMLLRYTSRYGRLCDGEVL